MSHPSPNAFTSLAVNDHAVATIKAACGLRTVIVAVGVTPAHLERIAKEADAAVAQLLREGRTLVRHDGAKVWRHRTPIMDLAEDTTPSGRYTWHADGERVRCQWTEYTQTTDGTRTERTLRRVWVSFDKAHGGAA